MSRWVEFFEGDGNRLSMTRLSIFITLFPSSYVVIATKDADALGYYLGAYVLGYVGGKANDVWKGKPNASTPSKKS
jgi:hypothetical protein